MEFDVFVNLLPKIRNLELPGEASQFKMSPPYRQELMLMQREKMKHAKKAAVMVLFYPDINGQTKLVLILRKTYQGVHSAQMGFPGGKLEKEDKSLQDAAIRETEEEVGVSTHLIEVHKQLTEVYIPPSNYTVYPFIGSMLSTPQFLKQDEEVEEIVEIPIQYLLDDQFVSSKKVQTSYNIEVDVPAFKFGGYVVWGATAMMLSEVKDLLKQVL